MGKNKNSQLLNNIKFLASQNADPFDSVASSMSSNAEKRLSKRRLVEDNDENKDTLKRLEEKLSRFGLDDNDFDSLIDTIDEYDEDSDLRNALIQEGRKYARDYAASSESSEIVKAFAPQETRLNTMLKEFDKEEIEINKDIDQMRFSRSRSGKSLADLITARASIAKTKLDIIKEIIIKTIKTSSELSCTNFDFCAPEISILYSLQTSSNIALNPFFIPSS